MKARKPLRYKRVSKQKAVRKRRQKSPHKKLKEALDAQWGRITKEIWGRKCAWCGSTENLQSDHIFNRWKHSTRWVVENCVILCISDHFFKKMREPAEWYEVVKRERGEELLEILRRESQRIEKPDLEQVKAYLDALERDRPWETGAGLGEHAIQRRAA